MRIGDRAGSTPAGGACLDVKRVFGAFPRSSICQCTPPPFLVFLHNTISYVHTMENSDPEERCNALRHDLKAWEKKFAAQNNGRKAGRDDIKANATICMHASSSLSPTLVADTL